MEPTDVRVTRTVLPHGSDGFIVELFDLDVLVMCSIAANGFPFVDDILEVFEGRFSSRLDPDRDIEQDQLLEEVQRAGYAIFEYLRVNGQVGRHDSHAGDEGVVVQMPRPLPGIEVEPTSTGGRDDDQPSGGAPADDDIPF